MLLHISTSFAQIERIEPPFWWAGMNHSQLQILIYGKNISHLTPKLPEAILLSAEKVDNPNYLFLKIETGSLPSGIIPIEFYSNGVRQFVVDYELLPRENNSAQRKGFDASDVIYLIMPDRFANGNPENDSVEDMAEKADRSIAHGRHGGDLRGIINHLDYLLDLGVTTLWLTPACEDNDPVYSYHGYAQSDVYRIDPRYGSNQEYKELADALHQKGMKLIKDYVPNHWGLHHWIVKNPPFPNWVNQFPGYAQTNHRTSTQFDPYVSKKDQKFCVDGWFVPSMPDLNQRSPFVLNYLIQNAIWWIEYANLDGLRVDTYSYNDKAAIAEWTKAIMDEYPQLNITGEIWMHNQAQIAYWQKDSPLAAIQGYNTHLPTVMDFTLLNALKACFMEDEKSGWAEGMIKVYENFANDFLYKNPHNVQIFMENHDTERFNELYDSNADNYKLALTLLLTTRGIPQLYYGSEIGMRGVKAYGDADIRRDFPGGWPGDEQNAFTKEGRTDAQNVFHDFTQKLLKWRKSKPVIHFGKMTHYIPEDNVYVYFRYNEEEKVMVILNNNKTEKSLKLERFSNELNACKNAFELFGNKKVILDNELLLPPKTPMILELAK
jgi:neopullulanase